MATAKQLPSGTWRCLVYSHKEKLYDREGKPIIDEKTGKQKEKRIYESFTSNLPGRKGKQDAEAQAATEPEFLVGKTLLAITNLPPRKMMGIDSCG